MVASTRTFGVSFAGFILLQIGCSNPSSLFRTGDRAPGSVASTQRPDRRQAPPSAEGPVDPFFVDHSAEAEARHYFTREKIVRVIPPDRYSRSEIPQVAVWWSDDNGFHWREAGHFNSEEVAFEFKPDGEGDYAFRFVGPNDPPAQKVLAAPELVFHVDATPPELQLIVEPEKSEYHPGERITLSWQASDPSLERLPVRIGLLPDFAAESPEFVELQRNLVPNGSFSYEIPSDAAEQQVLFRAEALDRCGNMGLAYSFAIPILPDCPDDPGDARATENGDVLTALDDRAAPGALPRRSRLASWARALSDRAREAMSGLYARTWLAAREAPQSSVPDLAQRNEDATASRNRSTRPILASRLRVWRSATLEAVTRFKESVLETTAYLAEHSFEPRLASAAEAAPDSLPEAVSSGPILDAGPDFSAPSASPGDVVEDVPLIEMPRPVPFASAVARLAESNARLIWRGPAPGEFPSAAAASASGRSPLQVASSSPDAEDQSRETGRHVAALAGRFGAALRGAFARFDPTRGNHLMVPMPATIETPNTRARFVTAHPWRMLGEVWGSPISSVWSLPETPRTVSWHPDVKGRFLADHPTLRNIAEPASKTRYIAGSDEIRAGDAP